MKAKDLSTIVKIASNISNASSLTSLFRSIELGPNSIRCCSEFGNLEIVVEATGLQEPCLVDTDSFMAIVSSLPQSEEVTFKPTPTKIDWVCGSAKGHLGIVQTDHKVPKLSHQNFPWTPPPNFANALILASTACAAAAVSFGMYGITVEPDGDVIRMMSCNTISLAATTVENKDFPTTKITLRPPVPGIIASLLDTCPCTFDFVTEGDNKGIFILGNGLMAQLPLGSNLDHDLKAISEKFTTSNHVAKINSASVKKFITRAKSLTDKKSNFLVSLKIEEGKLVLSHSAIASSTEEYFLADGLPADITYQPVELDADMLTLPLSYVQDIVLDYLPQQQLVLKGTNPNFLYVVSGGN